MEMNIFGSMMVDEIRGKLGSEYVVEYKEIIKNNGIVYHALLIRKTVDIIAPTIYIDDAYQEYCHGAALPVLAKKIIRVFRQEEAGKGFEVEFFSDFNKVCEHLTFKVVNFDRNRQILKDIPYKKMEDLAFIPLCAIESTEIGNGTITILNRHLSYWEVSFDELWENVFANAEKNTPVKIRRLSEFFSDKLGTDISDGLSELEKDILVITNESAHFGASCLFYPGFMKKMAGERKRDYIIIPSSVHETIIMPATSNTIDMQALSGIVKEVNETVLSKEDILSDNVYYYDAASDCITMVSEDKT